MTLRFAPWADKISGSSRYSARGLSLFAIGLSVALIIGCDSGGSTGGMEEDPTPPEEPPPGNTNEAPTAVAEVVTSSPAVDSTVTLSGSESDDPDGDELSYEWTITGPGDNAVNEEGESASFTPQEPGDYTVALEVSDGDTTDSDEATLVAELSAQSLPNSITEDRTLKRGEEYVIRGTLLNVTSGATLTAEAGVTIYFDEFDAMKIDDRSEFVANGTESNSVSLVGTPGSKEAGSWEGITVTRQSSVRLGHTTVRHSTFGIAINPTGPEPMKVEITNSTFEENSNTAVVLDEDARYPTGFELVDISDNSFGSSHDDAISIPFRKANALDGSNVFAEGQRVKLTLVEETLALQEGIEQSVTLSSLDGAKYRVDGKPEVNELEGEPSGQTEFHGDTLRVEPGTEVTFDRNALLDVKKGKGNTPVFLAEGTASDPITFTAPEAEANPERWQGINVTNEASAVFRHVIARYGGGVARSDETGSIFFFSSNGAESTLVVENSTITDSAGDGIVCGDGEVPLQTDGNTFENIAGENIRGCN